MRIITGKFKGRVLNMPKNNDVRPTTEKVKESIFSTILYYIDDSIICDLFSGTGSLGLEAISRGAKHCYFCDNNRESIELVKSNISMCKAENESTIVFGDYMKCLERLKRDDVKIDVFLLDPPYKEGLYENALRYIFENNLLNNEGIILMEHNTSDVFPDEFCGFTKIKEKHFGNVCFSIFSCIEN